MSTHEHEETRVPKAWTFTPVDTMVKECRA